MSDAKRAVPDFIDVGADSPKAIALERAAKRKRILRAFAGVGLGSVLIAWSGWSPPSPKFLVAYSSVVLIAVSATYLLPWLKPGRETYSAMWVVAFFAVGFYAKNDQYIIQRDAEDGSVVYTTYGRWSDRRIYFKMIHLVDNEFVAVTQGPCAGTGKRHGEWKYVSVDPPDSASIFYWYGEEISEAVWRARR